MAAWRHKISLLVLKKYFTCSLRSLMKYFSTLEEKFCLSARPYNILYLFWKINPLQWNFDIMKGQGQNMFDITRFRYIKVLFHIFYYYWGQKYCSLYQGLCYIEVHYIEVPLYITVRFTNMRILKFKSQLAIVFFAAGNHLNGPLRKQNFTLTGSKGHGLWSLIGGFWSVLCVSVWKRLLNFRVRMFVKSAVIAVSKASD